MGEGRNMGTIDLLAQAEGVMSELYQVYAKKFPELKGLWDSLSAEEAEHAAWVQKLAALAQENKAQFNEKRFDPREVKMVLDSVKDALRQITQENLSLVEALTLALYIERSLLERSFFEAFQADTGEVKQILQDLESDLRKHRKSIEDELAKRQ
jgi:rubrerythrin